MLTKVISNYLLISLLLVFTLFNGCESKSHPENPEKAWFHEDEFTQDATLHAKIHHTVILDISSPQQPGGSESHTTRYEYDESGEHVYCIDPDEKYITEMTLLDEYENVKLTLKKDDGCTNIYLEAGKYSMQITHDASKVSERGTVAFIKHPSDAATESAGDISSTTTNAFDETNPAYYAFEVSGGNYDGYYLGTKKEKFGNYWDFLGVISQDNNSNFMEKRHLFALAQKDGKQVLKGYDWSSHMMPQECSSWPFFCVQSQDSSLYDGNIVFSSLDAAPIDLYLQAEENQTYALWNDAIAYVLGSSSLYAAENSLLYRTSTTKESTDPTLFTKNPNMRFYKDGSQYTPQDGEVAFSSECNLTGPTYVISGDMSDSVIVPLPQIKAIKLGGNYATLSLFGEKDFDNLIKTVGMNDDCLDDPINFETVGSLKVFNAKRVLLSSHNCDYCNLAGAKLSSLDLNNVSLRYANLATTQFNNSILQKADMRYAKLYGANLNYADLSGSTMCGTFLNGNILLSGGSPATLSGAYMKNVNLAYSNLNGANFIDTNFHSPGSSGCGDADCGFTKQCATAVHSTIEGTDFTNAYLAGVDFSDSDLYGTNFTDAVLIGAKFTNATITGGATSSRAYSKFYGTFIQGVDFSNAKVTNTDFTNAYTNFNENALMFFRLNTNHTKFAGWPTPDDKVCVMHGYTYDVPTLAPSTDSSCICPDGSTGGCGDSVSPIWSDPKVPMDQSYQEASYGSDPVCSPPNINW